MDEVLGLEADDFQEDSSSSSITFPTFELPRLSEEAARKMEAEMGAKEFVQMWRRVQEDAMTRTLDTGEGKKKLCEDTSKKISSNNSSSRSNKKSNCSSKRRNNKKHSKNTNTNEKIRSTIFTQYFYPLQTT